LKQILELFTIESDGCAVAPANSRCMPTKHLPPQSFVKWSNCTHPLLTGATAQPSLSILTKSKRWKKEARDLGGCREPGRGKWFVKVGGRHRRPRPGDDRRTLGSSHQDL